MNKRKRKKNKRKEKTIEKNSEEGKKGKVRKSEEN